MWVMEVMKPLLRRHGRERSPNDGKKREFIQYMRIARETNLGIQTKKNGQGGPSVMRGSRVPRTAEQGKLEVCER